MAATASAAAVHSMAVASAVPIPNGSAAAGTAALPMTSIPVHHESASFLGVYDNVRGYYSRLTPMNKMQTSIGPTISPHPLIREAISKVPKAVRERFYGCGMPLPTGIDGLRVLDLGCGAGRDCYVAARLVGRAGEVIGVDMTDEQLRVASEFVPEYARTLGYQPHLRFVKGYIEFLSQLPELHTGSIDLCISNNAVNLSPNKELVLRSVFEILKEGGEFQFSDIYADRRLPNHVRTHPVLMGECLGGALYTEDFKRLCQRVGFVDARQVSPPAIVRIEAPELRDLVGATQFYSITFRLFKFARPASVLEPTPEDYGQVAVYRGTIDGQRARTRFDNRWAFEANRPVLVDGNTAVMLGESWLRRHFEVRGDRSLHFGGFTASPPAVQYEPWELDHELEEEEPQSGDRLPRRRGILPLPTPYFINGLRQQQQQQDKQSAVQALHDQPPSQAASRRASPNYDAAMPPPTEQQQRNSAMRDHQTTFPRLSSFSISQSNVRADGAIARSTAPDLHAKSAQQQQQPPRFILPVNRLSSSAYRPAESAPPRFASHQQQQPGLANGVALSPHAQSIGSPVSAGMSAGARSVHSVQSPVFSMPSSVRSPVTASMVSGLSVSASPRQHSPASVATAASTN
ncbi:S-adenosyl-L-methionine-dependent methyltransferase [Kickxella alabastrina]|uniref:S-adenosyl-L-methionine-dependent methyltransferase n=1 Tax=Kickxella alabastrina TaxID=61397 RepID=UPI00221EC154|nr:S-adenosyl-L-methionine-dependent methyltransferase [Kickxella alabastrina]KAI7822300.1 S-adenosyl-L-methionine-dependent methyltransferase [Kickxella alabastrina]